jgi:oligopeptide transport system substrate-binding protein
MMDSLESLQQTSWEPSGVPSLAAAKSVAKSDDGLTYTFKIRNAKWSSGAPVTAHDFVFSWRDLIDSANGYQYAFFLRTASLLNADAILKGQKPVEELGVKAIDDKTLELKLERPIPYLDNLLAYPALLPINEAFYKAQGKNYGTSPETINGNGAFALFFGVEQHSHVPFCQVINCKFLSVSIQHETARNQRNARTTSY